MLSYADDVFPVLETICSCHVLGPDLDAMNLNMLSEARSLSSTMLELVADEDMPPNTVLPASTREQVLSVLSRWSQDGFNP